MAELHLSILPAPQRRLWEELSGVPDSFVLFGGTAIALQLGHRQSVDFDFFARTDFDPTQLIEQVAFLNDCEPLQVERNTLTVRVQRQGPVLMSFFGMPRLPLLRQPNILEHPRFRLGHLLELGGMKAMDVQKRAEANDYLDIHALPQQRQEKVLPYIRQWVASAAALSAAQVFHGYSQMGVMREAAVNACQRFDYVISPVSPVPGYAAEWASPTNDPERPFEHIAFTLPFNMSEQPSASINCGTTQAGLPIGLQISGRRFDDLGVLQLCAAWERLRPAQRPWPLPPQR